MFIDENGVRHLEDSDIQFEKIEMKPGSIGEEIQRLLLTRGVHDGTVDRKDMAVEFSSLVVEFVGVVLHMVIMNVQKNPLDLAAVRSVFAYQDPLNYMALLRTMDEFIPYWLDSPMDEKGPFASFCADGILKAYNQFVEDMLKA